MEGTHPQWLIISAIFTGKNAAEMLIALMICKAKEFHTPVLSLVLVYKNKSLNRINVQRWRETDFKVCLNFDMWNKLGLPAQIEYILLFWGIVSPWLFIFNLIRLNFVENNHVENLLQASEKKWELVKSYSKRKVVGSIWDSGQILKSTADCLSFLTQACEPRLVLWFYNNSALQDWNSLILMLFVYLLWI